MVTKTAPRTRQRSGALADQEGVDMASVLLCLVDGCEKPANPPGAARGYCSGHYNRLRRYGDPLAGGRSPVGFPQNLELWIDRSGGPDACWPWTAAINRHTGYGMLGSPLSNLAHRAAWLHYVGAVPVGLDLDHLCHNADRSCPGGPSCPHRRCCNYERHLEPATRAQNLARGRGGN